LDPFRIEFPGDFVWEIPSELRGRIELMRRKRAGNTGETLATRFDRATNQQGLEIQLGQLVTPGDRIALAVDPHLPSLDAIVRLLLEELRRLKASLSESCVVFPPSAGALPQAVRDWLDSEEALREVQVITYDPEGRSSMQTWSFPFLRREPIMADHPARWRFLSINNLPGPTLRNRLAILLSKQNEKTTSS
jgi:hypothetical protein